MQTIELKGVKRSVTGKKDSKSLRNEEQVPCVVYGAGEVIHFSTLEKDFKNLIFTPNIYIVNVNIDGKITQTILKDVQYHPISGNILHVDFLQVVDSKPVVMEIPVVLNGLAEGVKAGGKLQLEMRKLKVKAFVKDMPDNLPIDITNLGLGKGIKVGELNYNNIEILNAKNAVVVAVKLTRAARAAAQGTK